METKLICFDLDGVLVDTEMMHQMAFISACAYLPLSVSKREVWRLAVQSGISTKEKIRQLTDDPEMQRHILLQKDIFVKDVLQHDYRSIIAHRYNKFLSRMLTHLPVPFCIVTNSRRETARKVLDALGLFWVKDRDLITPESPDQEKPSPYMYQKAMHLHNVTPEETVILEDSPVGQEAAVASGARVHMVTGPQDITLKLIYSLL